jgi:hypothetical protein
MRSMKATGCPKAFGSRPNFVFLENQLFPLQFKHPIFSNLQTPHETVCGIVYGSRYPDVSMADMVRKCFFISTLSSSSASSYN